MKKIISAILCLALLLAGAAAAESAARETLGTLNVNGAFNLTCSLAEGYKITVLQSDSANLVARITSEDESKPAVTLSVVFNDTYAPEGKGLRLNDVSGEDLEMIKASFTETMEVEEIRESETVHGTKLLIVTGAVGEENLVDLYSIYEGYEVEIVAIAGQADEDHKLSEEQIQMYIDFLSNLDFEAV